MADTSVGRRTKIENTTRNTGVAVDQPAGLRLSKTEGQLILKRFIEECFPPFQNIKGRFGHAVDWAGNWKETREIPCCHRSTKQAKSRNFRVGKVCGFIEKSVDSN